MPEPEIPTVPPGMVPTVVQVPDELDHLTVDETGEKIPLIPLGFQTPLGTHTYRLTADSAEFIRDQLSARIEMARAEASKLTVPGIVIPVPRMNGHGG